jgi:saccharopine dehydrogenase-like NADP-dependent oxidoreductase
LQHDERSIHTIDFPGLGTLEAIPNGDAIFFTDLMGITDTIRETGRYTIRWPGWSAFWNPLKKIGFLKDEPIDGLPNEISPKKILSMLLAPYLQYKENEKDLVVMYNVFEGIADQKKLRLISCLLAEREVETGLFAMSKTVGFSASIAAQMIATGEIDKKGLLSPIYDIPYEAFMDQLAQRGIKVQETEEIIG